MNQEVGRSVQQRMSAAEGAFHLLMIACTCGLWYPVYRSRKSKFARTLVHYR